MLIYDTLKNLNASWYYLALIKVKPIYPQANA